MSVNTIEDILGIDINYYAKVNFNTVTDLINMVGGVDIYSQIALRHCGVNAGNNHLDGKKALCFARERKAYVGGDRQRGVNQEIVIEALINKISTYKEIERAIQTGQQRGKEENNEERNYYARK